MIIPCIDLMNGKVVQLVQGEKKKLELDSYRELLKKFRGFEIQVIDLDAAKGEGSNKRIVKGICKKAKCRVGGGIRSIKSANEMISAGAKKVIIGSKAFSEGRIDRKFLGSLSKNIGRKKIIIALDSKKGEIVIKGWREGTGISAVKVAGELEPYCSEFLYTYVDKEGMMQGTDLKALKKLRNATKNEITAAGGISSIKEIEKLEKLGINSALGMALYTGKLKVKDLQRFKI
ncbi:MAG TPA: 1-(5-phosphoribosyl)-5-[(5-phosphoribosylamino)methylideneamino] imidazole-4-carboxamide isomerase [Candidatus Nanoarchaeia archaeon]|nr:1-(5-phosphoribosyl)-5-[(5-phosphoribosylamino)methylideneamino] imidazole-4-carboxamide isomerase [Candidatus Nanoarchaeia archaeon]